MDKKAIISIGFFLLLIGSMASADCLMGWFCKDATHRGYRDCECNWSFVEYCPHGCAGGVCTPEPNNPPSIPIVEITPAGPDSGDGLVCHAESTDADGYQNIEYTYKWYKNGEYYKTIVSTSNTAEIDSSHTSEGEEWMCKARAYDHATYSNYGYDTVTISGGQDCTPGWKCKDCCTRAYQNADCSWENEEYCINGCLGGQCVGDSENNPPADPEVHISPSEPGEGDTLTCYAYSDDADNDDIEYHFTWKQDGSVFRTESTYAHTSSISGTRVNEGEEWQCRVKAWDGEDYSDCSIDTVIVGEDSCDFELLLDPEQNTVYMEENDFESVSVRIKNESSCYHCFDLGGKDSSSRIKTGVSRDRVCLNAGESTYVALEIETIDATGTSYTAKIEAKKGSETESASVQVRVDSCDGCGDCIDLVAYRKTVCRGEKENLRVLVKNNTGELKEIELSASSNEFLASFEENKLELDAHSEEYASLELYIYGSTSLGSHYVTVYAETDGERESEKAYFTVKECEEPEENSFSLSMTSACQPLGKGEDKNIQFTLRNKTGSELTVHLQTVSDLPTEVPLAVRLDPHDSERFEFNVRARDSDEHGSHDVKLYAWTETYRIMKKACVDVEKQRETRVSLEEDSLEIIQCENGVFVLSVENLGDYEEEYEIEISNSTAAKVKVSDDKFELGKGEGKQVFINVDVPLDMGTGNYHFDVLVINRETFTKRVNFSVKEAEETGAARVELTHYPSKVVLVPGEEKLVSFTVTNLSLQKITGIALEWSLPDFVFTPDNSIDAEGNETMLVEQLIAVDSAAEPGTYYGKLSMEFDGKKTEKTIAIVIVEPETVVEGGESEEEGKEETSGFLMPAGFFSLGEPMGIGLIILLLIVITMVALKGVIESDTDYTKPVWHRR